MREALVIGIGCTRGTPCDVLAAGIDDLLARHALRSDDVQALASVDVKRDEAGLLELARTRGWSLCFYDAATLAEVAIVRPSEVVRDRVGTPGVAEPAAILRAERGPLRVPKTVFAADGHAVTLAVAAMRDARDG